MRIKYRSIRNAAICATLLFAGLGLFAQQDAQYSQYMFNQLAYNPAYAGSREALSATMVLRRQWMGFVGGPATGNINIHSPSGNERHGFGFNMVSDRLCVTNQTMGWGSYAFRMPLKGGFLSLGLSGGAMQYKVRYSEITPKDTDPVKPDQDLSAIRPQAGAGAYYSSDRFYAGLSVPNLMAGRYFKSQNLVASQLAAKQSMHSFGMIGAALPIGSSVVFRPSALVKYVPQAPFQAEFNATFFFAKTIGLGVGYRMDDAMVFMLEFTTARRFRAGYAYDLTLSQLRGTNSGSHEVMIGLDLNWGKANFLSPRYF